MNVYKLAIKANKAAVKASVSIEKLAETCPRQKVN